MKTNTTTTKKGRPAAKLTWPKGKFTLRSVLNRRNGNGKIKILNTVAGIKARAVKDIAAGVLFECGIKPRKKGEVGRPQFLYSTDQNDVPKA